MKALKVFHNRCPVCQKAPIFRGLFSMNRVCPVCGNRFEKEEGYFMGAMIIAYFVGTLLALPTLLIAVFVMQVEFPIAVMLASLQMVVLGLFLFRFSRLAWINIENYGSQKLK